MPKHQAYRIVIWTLLLIGTSAQELPQSLNGGQDEFKPSSISDEKLNSRQSVGESDGAEVSEPPPVTIPTLSFHEPSNGDGEQPPDAQESHNNDTPQAMASLVFIAAIVALCVVGCVAFFGGMFCWYKHTGMVTSARRVLYRSSDSSVLIHNGYQPMNDEVNGHVTTNNNMSRLAEKTDYPAYGVTGPNPLHYSKGPPIDVNLNRNAEVFHYQQQKQRLKSLNSTSSNSQSPDGSRSHATTTDQEDDEENSDGEYTVYECPGLASTTDGPLEIHNPLFADAETFSSYSTPSLGGSIVTSAYSTTVGGKG